ncbi:MAG: hypothetical protein EOR08_00695 [Mesorhizobium sp.]|nr:MAG: hypothetical protein EOR08_00695 [Mesorhizobium sp.]
MTPQERTRNLVAVVQPNQNGFADKQSRREKRRVEAAARGRSAALPAAQRSAIGPGLYLNVVRAGCIDFLKTSGVFDRSKNFCTKLRVDSGPVFATLSEAFLRFAAPQGHVALDLTVSTNSPSPR